MREPSKNGFFADDIDLGDADFASLPDFTGDDLNDIFAAESAKNAAAPPSARRFVSTVTTGCPTS